MTTHEANRWVPFAERVQLVHHKSFTQTLKKCVQIDRSPEGMIFFVAGPSGAGKTKLSKMIGEKLYGNSFPSDIQPHVWVSAENPQAGYFTSKYLIGQLLAGFRDPFYGMYGAIPGDIPPDLAARLGKASTKIATGERATEETRRKALIGIARALNCRLVVIDEANLMSMIKRGRPVEAHLESLRSLALAMGVRVILFGTFMMLDYVDYSAQINRVGIVHHLDRIRDETAEEMLDFLAFLDRVQQDLEELSPGLLVENAEAIYEATYGIPGELVSLLERARISAATDDRMVITVDDVEKSFRTKTARERMRAEADFVEAFVRGEIKELRRFDHSSRRQSIGKSATWGGK